MDIDDTSLAVFGVIVAALAGAVTCWLSPPNEQKSTPLRPLRLLLVVVTVVSMAALSMAGQGLIVATLLPIVVYLFMRMGKSPTGT